MKTNTVHPVIDNKPLYENIARATQEEDGRWRQQLLLDHLEGTAQRAGEFAAVFGYKVWSVLLGW